MKEAVQACSGFYSCISLERLRKTRKSSIKIAIVPFAEILTNQPPYKRLELCFNMSLLGQEVKDV